MSTTVRVYTRYAELSLPLVILDNPSDAVQLASHQSHGVLTQLYADDDCEAHLYFARRACTMVSFIDCAMVLLRSSVDLRLHAFKSSSQNFICLGIDCCCCCCVIYLSMQYWDCGFSWSRNNSRLLRFIGCANYSFLSLQSSAAISLARVLTSVGLTVALGRSWQLEHVLAVAFHNLLLSRCSSLQTPPIWSLST